MFWAVLKFVLGVGAGLTVGAIVAAMLAPAAGEETRRKARELIERGPEALGDDGLAGLIADPQGRLRVALDEARRARQERERELTVELAIAKQTGSRRP